MSLEAAIQALADQFKRYNDILSADSPPTEQPKTRGRPRKEVALDPVIQTAAQNAVAESAEAVLQAEAKFAADKATLDLADAEAKAEIAKAAAEKAAAEKAASKPALTKPDLSKLVIEVVNKVSKDDALAVLAPFIPKTLNPADGKAWPTNVSSIAVGDYEKVAAGLRAKLEDAKLAS